jgi:DNA-binding beta-propeller fold protein YncE
MKLKNSMQLKVVAIVHSRCAALVVQIFESTKVSARLLLVGNAAVALMAGFSPVKAADIPPAIPQYSIIERIPGPGTDWDYLAVDAATRRLYIAHDGVTALNLNTHKLTPHLVAGKITHGVLPLGDDLVAVNDSATGTTTLFKGTTGAVRGVVKIPSSASQKGFHDPDALAFEPKTGLLVAVNGDSGEFVLIDPKKRAVVGRIGVGEDLEFAVADGAGMVFVNVVSTNEIAAVDIGNRKVTQRFALMQCRHPTGLAFDSRDALLIAACGSGAVTFVDAHSGQTVKTLPVGRGPDAVVFDAARRLAFVPSGFAGTLSVVAVRSPSDIALVQTLATQLGARTAALDPESGRLYVPTAKLKPPTAAIPFPTAIEGTFEILVIAPQ